MTITAPLPAVRRRKGARMPDRFETPHGSSVTVSSRPAWWEGVPGLDRSVPVRVGPGTHPAGLIRFLARTTAIACGIRVFGPGVITGEREKFLRKRPGASVSVIGDWYRWLAGAADEADAAVRRHTLRQLAELPGADAGFILHTAEMLCQFVPCDPAEPEETR